MTVLSVQPDRELLPVTNLREFFRESINAAITINNVEVDQDTAHYVVNLLTLFARSEQFHDPAEKGSARKPLALMLADAIDAPSADERLYGLQRLGDISLFMAGFFADDLQHSVVDLDYYISMGGGAYSTLSKQSRGTFKGKAFGGIFAELGEKFHCLVDVLNDVRHQALKNHDTPRLYDVWLKTGSARAARLLREAGVHPLPESGLIRRH